MIIKYKYNLIKVKKKIFLSKNNINILLICWIIMYAPLDYVYECHNN